MNNLDRLADWNSFRKWQFHSVTQATVLPDWSQTNLNIPDLLPLVSMGLLVANELEPESRNSEREDNGLLLRRFRPQITLMPFDCRMVAL